MLKKISYLGKNILLVSFLYLFIFSFVYLVLEPRTLKSATDTKYVTLNQEVVEEIGLTCSTNVSGLTAINGITGGTSNGSFDCNVITSNSGGYNMKLKKSASLCHSTLGCGTDKQFDDYATTTDPLDFNWANTPSGAEYWGFNVSSSTYPTAVTQRFKDNGSQCNTGTNVTDGKCWTRIPTGPTEETVVNRTTATTPEGDTTYFGVRIQAGSNNALNSGTYTTTIVVTATTN